MWNEAAARRAYYAYGVDLIRTAGLLLQTTPSVIYRASMLFQQFERLVDERTRSCYMRNNNIEDLTRSTTVTGHNINENDNEREVNNVSNDKGQNTHKYKNRERHYYLHKSPHKRCKEQIVLAKPKTEAVNMEQVFGSEVARDEENEFNLVDPSETISSSSSSSSLPSESSSDSFASRSEPREECSENDHKENEEYEQNEEERKQQRQTFPASATSLSESSLMSLSPLSTKSETECATPQERETSLESTHSQNKFKYENECEEEWEHKCKEDKRSVSETLHRQYRKHVIVEYYLPNHVNERMPSGIVPLIDLFAPLDYCVMHYRTNDDIVYLAAACLLVAAKMEDSGVRISSVVTAFLRLSMRRNELYTINNDFMNSIDNNFVNGTNNSNNSNNFLCKPPQEKIDDFQGCVIDAEEILLHMVGFQTFVETPYKYLVLYFHTLIEDVSLSVGKNDKVPLREENAKSPEKQHWLTRQTCLDWISKAVSWCNDVPRCHKLCTLPASTLAVYALHWSCPAEVNLLLPCWTEAFGVTSDMLGAVTEVYKSYLSTIVLPASLELDAICNFMPPPTYCTIAEKEAKTVELLQNVKDQEAEEQTANNSTQEEREVITDAIAAVTDKQVDNNNINNINVIETHQSGNVIIDESTKNTENESGEAKIIATSQPIVLSMSTSESAENNKVQITSAMIDDNKEVSSQLTTATLNTNTDAVTAELENKDDTSALPAKHEESKDHDIVKGSDTATTNINNIVAIGTINPELEFEDIREMRKRLRREEKERIRREHENAKKARERSAEINEHHINETNKVASSTADVGEHNNNHSSTHQTIHRKNLESMERCTEANEKLSEERAKIEMQGKVYKTEHRTVPRERDERKEERDYKLRIREKESHREVNVPHKVHRDKYNKEYQHHDMHRHHREHRDSQRRREYSNRSRSGSFSRDDKVASTYEASHRHTRHDDRAGYDGNARKRHREDSYDNKYDRYGNWRGDERDSNRPKRYDIHRERNDEHRRRR